MIKRPHFPKRTQCVPMALLLLLLCSFASGCWKPSVKKNNVLEPPLIPAPPAQKATDSPSAQDVGVQAFADQLDLENTRLYPPDLAKAVAHAITLGVLKPSGLQDRFEPERSITYGEFRQWALAYQSALYGYQALPSAEALAEANISTEGLKPDLTGPMSPEKLFILPEKLETGSHSIQLNQALSRESLCLLYFLLTRQESALQALSQADIEGAFPPATGSGAEESFSQFKDYSGVSLWARPAVALFYKNGQLQPLFRKTTDQLIIDEGFHPQKNVNRGEAIVLLHWAYGKIPPKTAEAKPVSEPTTPSHAKLRLPGGTSEASPAMPPSPLGRWKFSEEKSPQAERKVLEVNGPD